MTQAHGPGPGTGTSRGTILRILRTGLAGNALTFLFGLALLPFVLRQAGPSLYGAWIAMTTVAALAALADAGIRIEIARRVAHAYGRRDMTALTLAVRDGMATMLVAVTVVGVVGLAATPWVEPVIFPRGVHGYSDSTVIFVLRLVLLLTLAQLITDCYFAPLQGVQRSDITTLAQVAGLPANALVLVLTLRAGWGLWGLACSTLASVVVAAAVQWTGMRRILPTVRFGVAAPSRSVVARFAGLSALALFSQVSDVFDSQWDKLVLSHFTSTPAVAAFHIGSSLALQAKAIAVLPLTPLLAAVAELGDAHPERAIAIQRTLMRIGAVLSSLTMGGLFVFGPAFIGLWLGDNYGDTGKVTRFFAVAVVLNLVSAPLAFQAYAEKRHQLAAAGALVNMLVNLVGSLILTMRIGLMGAVVGSILGNLAGTAVFLFIAQGRLSSWTWPPVRSLAATTALSLALIGLGWDRPSTWQLFAAEIIGFALLVAVVGSTLEGIHVRDLRAMDRRMRAGTSR